MSLLSQLLELPPGEAVFDMDGTLIRGDIGESVMRRCFGRLPPKALSILGTENPWKVYEEMAARDFCEAGDVAALVLAGLRVEEVEALVDRCVLEGDVSFNTPVLALAKALSVRHRVWIVTGSAEVIGRAMGKKMGINHVIGLRLREEGGVLQEELLPPCTCGKGKVEATLRYISPNPVFSIGDSPTDLPLLRIATVARTLGKIAGREFPAFVEND